MLICHSDDQDALWLYQALKEKGCHLELLNADILSSAWQWKYSLNASDSIWELFTPGKRKITSEESGLVINRMQYAIPYLWQKSDQEEYQYVSQEMRALCMSWLYSISQKGLMLNPPGGNGLSGNLFSESEWNILAAKAGLPTRSIKRSSFEEDVSSESKKKSTEGSLLFLNGEKIAPAGFPAELLPACKKLIRLSANPLLEINFTIEDKNWVFNTANSFPSFPKYKEEIIAVFSQSFAWS